MIIFSALLHVAAVAGMALLNIRWFHTDYYGGARIYQVSLVSPPSGGGTFSPAVETTAEQFDGPTEVVSPKEAAVPQESSDLALSRIPRKVAAPPGGTGEGQMGFESGTPGIRLDRANFEYPYYLTAIQRKIQQNFLSPQLAGVQNVRAMMYFKITRAGQVYDMVLESSSGVGVFDDAARRALLNASPLPPLPDGFDEGYLGVHFVFQYRR